MFVGYVLKKTASGTTSYIVESPSGGISKTTDKSQATIFSSKTNHGIKTKSQLKK